MENLKVTFYGQDKNRKEFTCIFSSEKSLDKFLSIYKNYKGVNRFEFDIWTDNCKENLPVIVCNNEGFRKVYYSLYLRPK
jgi:hypothetical protein